MKKQLIVLAILAITLVANAGASNYMYEKASVKGVGYKNVEMIISTQTGFNGAKLVEKESGSGNVITERTELEAERQLDSWTGPRGRTWWVPIGFPEVRCEWATGGPPNMDYINFTKRQSSSTCPYLTRPALMTRSGSRNSVCRTTGSALC